MAARAIIRDLYAAGRGQGDVKALSGLAVVTCRAPHRRPADGMVQLAGRLLTLAVFGAAALALVVLRFPETLAQPRPQHALRPAVLVRPGRPSCATRPSRPGRRCRPDPTAALFTFLAASSFVLRSVCCSSMAAVRPADVLDNRCPTWQAPLPVPPHAAPDGRAPRPVAIGGGMCRRHAAQRVRPDRTDRRTAERLVHHAAYYLFMLGHGVPPDLQPEQRSGPSRQAAGQPRHSTAC